MRFLGPSFTAGPHRPGFDSPASTWPILRLEIGNIPPLVGSLLEPLEIVTGSNNRGRSKAVPGGRARSYHEVNRVLSRTPKGFKSPLLHFG